MNKVQVEVLGKLMDGVVDLIERCSLGNDLTDLCTHIREQLSRAGQGSTGDARFIRDICLPTTWSVQEMTNGLSSLQKQSSRMGRCF